MFTQTYTRPCPSQCTMPWKQSYTPRYTQWCTLPYTSHAPSLYNPPTKLATQPAPAMQLTMKPTTRSIMQQVITSHVQRHIATRVNQPYASKMCNQPHTQLPGHKSTKLTPHLRHRYIDGHTVIYSQLRSLPYNQPCKQPYNQPYDQTMRGQIVSLHQTAMLKSMRSQPASHVK